MLHLARPPLRYGCHPEYSLLTQNPSMSFSGGKTLHFRFSRKAETFKSTAAPHHTCQTPTLSPNSLCFKIRWISTPQMAANHMMLPRYGDLEILLLFVLLSIWWGLNNKAFRILVTSGGRLVVAQVLKREQSETAALERNTAQNVLLWIHLGEVKLKSDIKAYYWLFRVSYLVIYGYFFYTK